MPISPLIVTHFLLEGLSVGLIIPAAIVGVQVRARWRLGVSPEARYSLEKKVYLVVTLVTVALGARLLLLPLWFATLSSLIPAIPGAMCLTGVHAACPAFSIPATSAKFLSPMLYVSWLFMDSLDRSTKTQPLMRAKLFLLLPIALVIAGEAYADLGYLAQVKPKAVSCCSSIFDFPDSKAIGSVTQGNWAWVGMLGSLGLASSALGVTRLPRRSRAWGALLSATSLLALIALPFSLQGKLSPILLGAPFHHCIFCVWQTMPDTVLWSGLIVVGLWVNFSRGWLLPIGGKLGGNLPPIWQSGGGRLPSLLVLIALLALGVRLLAALFGLTPVG